MKVAVVGASGFIGRNLCDFFRQMNCDVVEYSSKKPHWLDPQTGVLNKDFSFDADIDCVFYLSQSPYYRVGEERPEHLVQINANLPHQLAMIAGQQGIKKFFYTSTGNVYADSFSPFSEESPLRTGSVYAASKIQGEQALMGLQGGPLSISILRLFGVFGAGQNHMMVYNLAQRILKGENIFLERNPQDATDVEGIKVSYIFIRDLVSLLYRLCSLDELPRVLNLGGPQAVSIKSLCLQLEAVLGSKAQFVISDKMRATDFNADISKLRSLVKPEFHSFSNALKLSFQKN